jgi:ubiquinone/menaquinone biosynthesis C-methylase UbiE
MSAARTAKDSSDRLSPSFESYGGAAPSNYERYFVPALAAPLAIDLVDAASLTPGESVLDLACGTGAVARVAAERLGTATVEAADVNPAMIDVARSIEANPPISWHHASAEALPFADVAYDAVLCQMGLQFFSDKLLALREARRVLRARGRFLATVPSPIPSLFMILAEQLEHHGQPSAAEFVRQVFSLGDTELEELLDRAGFADISVTTSEKALRLPAPHDFLWQYVTSTPLGAVFTDLDDTQRRDFARDVVEEWRSFVKRGSLVLDLRLVLASAVAP